MPLQRKRLQTLTIHAARKPVIGENDRIPRFEAAGRTIAGTLQPMDGAADRQMYGERVTRLRRLITTEGDGLCMGMGVCTGNAAGCDYRIMQPVSHWQGHSVAVLEKLD
ncbi:MAG: hypothetical protein IKC28_01175 [Clostridia bacterium]|nr:hypothetical protein [Clostridia bacterium]